MSRSTSSALIHSQQERGRRGAAGSSAFAPTFRVLAEHKMPARVSCPSAASAGTAEGHVQFQHAFKFGAYVVHFHGTCDRFEHFKLSSILSAYVLEKSCWLEYVLKA